MKCFFGHKWDMDRKKWDAMMIDVFNGVDTPVIVEYNFRTCTKCKKRQWLKTPQHKWMDDSNNLYNAEKILLTEYGTQLFHY